MSGVHRPLFPIVGLRTKKPATASPRPRGGASINPFPIFALPDITVALIFTGIVYAVNYTVTSTISSSFADAYPWLSVTVLGLSYLPTGLGMIIGSTFMGKLLDWDYVRIKKRLGKDEQSADFPKEYARLRTMPAHLVLFVVAVIGWGWCIETRTHMAVPLSLQVIRACNASRLSTLLTRRSRMDVHLDSKHDHDAERGHSTAPQLSGDSMCKWRRPMDPGPQIR